MPPGPGPVRRGGGLRVVVGRDERDLGPLDLGGQVPHALPVRLDADQLRRVRDELAPSARGSAAAAPPTTLGQKKPSWRSAAAWNVRAWTPGRAEQPQPRAHLPRRTGRERHGQHVARPVGADLDAVRDAVRDRARLARAGAGEHADGSAQRGRDGTLLGVERVEEGFGGHRGTVSQPAPTASSHGLCTSGTVTRPRDVGKIPGRADVDAPGDDLAAHRPPTDRGPMTTQTLPDAGTVTMYSTTWCGYCRRLKTQLDSAGIGYTEVDIEDHPDAAALVESLNGGNQTVPTVVFPDGSAATNPSLAQVKQRLAWLAADR